MNAVLLLHGQPGSARDWDQLARALGATAHTVALERPGWDGVSAATDLAGNAGAAVAALDGRAVERATVVGHSFGGAVAAWLAIHQPERVAALVLVAPAANTASLYAFDRLLAAPLIGPALSAAALNGAGLVLGVRALRRRLARELALDEDYLLVARRRLLGAPARRSFVREQRSLVAELPQLELGLSRIAVPTTIVGGGADRIVPPGSLRRLAEQIPGARLIVLERAGHLLPLQNAPALAEIILGDLPPARVGG